MSGLRPTFSESECITLRESCQRENSRTSRNHISSHEATLRRFRGNPCFHLPSIMSTDYVYLAEEKHRSLT